MNNYIQSAVLTWGTGHSYVMVSLDIEFPALWESLHINVFRRLETIAVVLHAACLQQCERCNQLVVGERESAHACSRNDVRVTLALLQRFTGIAEKITQQPSKCNVFPYKSLWNLHECTFRATFLVPLLTRCEVFRSSPSLSDN